MDSSVAITLCAHTSLGTQPIYLFGSEEQKQEWMPKLCAGEILGAFGLTEPEPAPTRATPRPARVSRTRVGHRRRQAVHHQRGHRHLRRGLHHSGDRRRGQRLGHQGDLQPHRAQRDARLRQGEPYARWAGTRPTRDLFPSPTATCPRPTCSDPAAGASSIPARARHRPHRVAAMGVGLAQGRSTRPSRTPRNARHSARRSPSSRPTRPSSPTWRPRSRPRAARLQGRLREGPRPATSP